MKSVIHLGANKTGSTTLQRCLFAKSEKLHYLGEDCLNFETYKETLNSLVSDDDMYYNKAAAQAIFTQVLKGDPHKTAIYSNEDIMASRVPTLCAQRLKKLLPDAEILVVIRNQLTAIPSWYANHGAFLKWVPRCHWKRYVPFDDWMQYCIEFIDYSPLASFFYDRLLNLYASLFGKEKIHILFYEEFVADMPSFVKKLCTILESDPNEAITLLANKRERTRNTDRMIRYHKLRNWLFWNHSMSRYLPGGVFLKRCLDRYLVNGKPYQGFVSQEWQKKITALYAEDNSRFAKDYNLPLDRYHYPLTV